jgi:hypothetical protein
MPKTSLDDLPEVFVSNADIASAVSRAVTQGRIRQIATKLYTFNLDDPPERIVRRSLWELVATYVPGALIADRTAIENRPASDGSIFVVSDRKRDIVLPGITIRSRSGAPPSESDRPFVGGLFLSSTARAFLDNMASSRKRSGPQGCQRPQHAAQHPGADQMRNINLRRQSLAASRHRFRPPSLRKRSLSQYPLTELY